MVASTASSRKLPPDGTEQRAIRSEFSWMSPKGESCARSESESARHQTIAWREQVRLRTSGATAHRKESVWATQP